MHVVSENHKSLGQVAEELKNEAKEFVQTRAQIFQQEMQSKVSVWKGVLPVAVMAALLGATSFLVVTFAIIAFLAGIFLPSPYAWCYAALIVFAIYLFAAFGLFYLAKKELQAASLTPERTMRVLRDDQLWMQKEARVQL
jgi:hypothetical protein